MTAIESDPGRVNDAINNSVSSPTASTICDAINQESGIDVNDPFSNIYSSGC